MARYAYIALCAALCLTVASAVTSVGQATTTASFAAPPSVVVNAASGAADATAWGATAITPKFGPGADNTTVVTYGLLYTSTAITSLITRVSNASLISNGTADTTLAAKIGTDGTYTTPITITSGPMTAVGLGSIGVAYVALDTATTPCSQVWLAIFSSSGSLLVKAQVTSNTGCTAACSATVTASKIFSNTVTNVFYENATYYVTYTTTTATNAYVAANTACAASDTTQVSAYLQGVAATSSGTLKYSTVPAIYTGSSGSSIAAATLSPMCYAGNDTKVNSTNFYCTMRSADTLVVTSYVTVGATTGTVGTGGTIATDTTTTAGTYPLTTVAFTPVGFVASEYQTGFLINNLTTYTATNGGTATYTNTLQLYNLTTGATSPSSGGTQLSQYTNTYASGQYAGSGTTFSQGYALLTTYSSAASTYNSNFGTFFSNGTLNQTGVVTVATGGASTGNFFADANGALWFGAYTYDSATSNDFLTATVGKVSSQLFYSAGNVLASFFALVSLMIAALFAF